MASHSRRFRIPAGRFRSHGRWYVLLAAILGAVTVYYGLQWRTFMDFVNAIDHDAMFMPDFVHHYYPMSRRILHEAIPVERYYYTAFFAILMAPIGALSLHAALVVWTVFQVVALAALSWLSARLLGFGPRGTVLLTGLFVTSFPVLHNFKWGQVSVPITAGVIAAHLMARRRPFAAGGLLGILTAIKFYPAVFALPWLARGPRRALLVFAAAFPILYLLLPGMLLGFGDWLAFEKATSFALRSAGWIRYDVNSHYIAHVGARWFTIVTGREAGAGFLLGLTIVGLALATALLACAWLQARRSADAGRALSLVTLFVALPFVVRTSWPHYFVCLPLCQAALLAALLPSARRSGVGGKLLLLLPAGSMVLSSIFLFNLFPNWGTYNTCGMLFFANLLLVPACALTALRRRP